MKDVVYQVGTLVAGFIFFYGAYTLNFKGELDRTKFLWACIYAIGCVIVVGGFATYVGNGFR